ncbi:HNH endonuclease [Tepidibacter sp. Z1-5]|uniref:HNH endonuclease n=1 Tax=Tepidibacter sp. Z1-5 TaxID=3134138 RepID=UPI0030BAEC85
MCRHPIRTAQGFGQILRHPFKTVTAIGLTVGKSFVDDVIYGDANSRARFLGRTVFEVGSIVLPSKVASVGKVEKMVQAQKVQMALKGIDLVKDISKTKAFAKVAGIIEKADILNKLNKLKYADDIIKGIKNVPSSVATKIDKVVKEVKKIPEKIGNIEVPVSVRVLTTDYFGAMGVDIKTAKLCEIFDGIPKRTGGAGGTGKKFNSVDSKAVVNEGLDEAGNIIERWVVPDGFDSVEDFLKTIDNNAIKDYGYNNIDEFKEVVENTNKYLNASDKNTIINQSLAGGTHKNGLKYDILGYPIFEGKDLVFEHDLPKDLIENVTDIEQFENCTMALHDAIKNGEIPENLFTSTQLQQIIDGKARIKGLTWHHHQVTGRMQLVNAKIHQANHLGGNAIWGGGIR